MKSMSLLRRVGYVLLACLPVSRSALAADWPTFAHDNQRTSVTAEDVTLPLQPQWVFHSPAPPAAGWSVPVSGYGARKNKSNVSYDDAFRTICVQGAIVLPDFDIVRAAGGNRRAITRTFQGIKVTSDLTIGLQLLESRNGRKPVLCAFAAERE